MIRETKKNTKTIKKILFLLSFCYFYLGKCEMISSFCPLLRKKVLLCCVARSTLVSHLIAVPASSLPKMSHDYDLMAVRWGSQKPASHSSGFAPFVCPTIVFIENYYDKRVLASFWAALVDLRGLCRVVGLQKTITFVYFWLISLVNINYSDITRCMRLSRYWFLLFVWGGN